MGMEGGLLVLQGDCGHYNDLLGRYHLMRAGSLMRNCNTLPGEIVMSDKIAQSSPASL